MKEYSQEDIAQFLKERKTGLIYLYTPLCGTCQTASKILTVIEELLKGIHITQTNLNYASNLAQTLSIESVPCLLVIKNGQISEKIYAFHSVPYIYEKLNDMLKTKKVR